MCDSDHDESFIVDTSFTRRSVVLGMSSAAAAAALPTAACAAAAKVIETDVTITTADGSADAVLFRPKGSGKWPAVLMWPDILGLRPVFREMGHGLAEQGYVVLVPNPFYRTNRAPVVSGSFDFGNAQQREGLMAIRDKLTDEMVDRDAAAFLTFLDQQKATDRSKGAGVQGYCFSGPFAFHTGAVRSDRIRAIATFHGGGLVSKEATSPHLLIPKTNARFVVAIARNDDARQPEAKDVFEGSVCRSQAPSGGRGLSRRPRLVRARKPGLQRGRGRARLGGIVQALPDRVGLTVRRAAPAGSPVPRRSACRRCLWRVRRPDGRSSAAHSRRRLRAARAG
jgi:carboxymethylenebutenolidase